MRPDDEEEFIGKPVIFDDEDLNGHGPMLSEDEEDPSFSDLFDEDEFDEDEFDDRELQIFED